MASAVSPAALVSRCKRERGGQVAGLIGARHLVPLLGRLRTTLKVDTITIGNPTGPARRRRAEGVHHRGRQRRGRSHRRTRRKDELHQNWEYIDRTVFLASAALTGAALVLAVLIARSLGRPIAELAAEARKVATDEANPLRVRGSGEIAELVQAFDRMLDDLAATRRRLAATSRVAAWREVARRVAHEVKNPLAPIRAAVETLRRLRARNDPAFDEYFDEATRTVLDEVHRISNIVTEFTRFARLPAPRPQEVDLDEVARHVVQLQKATAATSTLDHEARRARRSGADRDQIVQVLMNLVQNAIEAVKGEAPGGCSSPSARRPGLVDITVRTTAPASLPNGRLASSNRTRRPRPREPGSASRSPSASRSSTTASSPMSPPEGRRRRRFSPRSPRSTGLRRPAKCHPRAASVEQP